MREAYCQVIDLIAEDKIDWRAFGITLAKASPATFIKIHEFISDPANQESESVEMDKVILSYWAEGQKFEAIKHCRQQTGWGLKEAKDYCDALGVRGIPNDPWTKDPRSPNEAPIPNPRFRPDLKALLDKLVGPEVADARLPYKGEGEFA